MKRRHIYTAIIVTLIAVSTGHVGQLFAARESGNAWPLGYVMAVALDSVMVVGLDQAARSARLRKLPPLAVFMLACAVSGGFNYQYYRQNDPGEPPWVSATLGLSAPVLAALVSVLRALHESATEETERKAQETERQQKLDHELALETVRQQEETKRKIAATSEKERTAQLRAEARRAKAEAEQRKAEETQTQQAETKRQRVEMLGNERATYDYYAENPGADRATAAGALGVSKRTVGNHLARLRGLGLIRENGSGIEVAEVEK